MLKKYIRIEFYGYSPERFINMCKHKQIKIWGLESNEYKYSFFMNARDFQSLKSLAKKAKVHVKITERHGLAFHIFRYRKRKGFFAGILLSLFIILWLSRCIWRIDIEGNRSITDDVLFEYLQKENVYHGMLRKDVDCEAICKKLRIDFNSIIWVSTSLEGTNLSIVIREGKEPAISNEEITNHKDIIANTDGIISSIVTRKGVAKVSVGDVVKKGDILVSGTIEVKNDTGETVREDLICADADIEINHSIPYYGQCDNTYLEKKYSKSKRNLIGIRVGEYILKLGIRNNHDKQERKSAYYSLRISDNFILPIEIEIESSQEYVFEQKEYPEDKQKELLMEQYNIFCEDLRKQGIEIAQEDMKYYRMEDRMIYQGDLDVIQQVVDLY